MFVEVIPPLTEPCGAALPVFADTALVVGQVADHAGALLQEELAGTDTMAPQRLRAFASGRHYARTAMGALAQPPRAITRHQDRSPVWPGQLRGSITHSRELAAAVVSTSLTSVGLDIELCGRMQPRLHTRVFTDREQQWLAEHQLLSTHLADVCFSAKEAGYKAIYALAGRYIGFMDAEIDVDWNSATFKIRYLGAHPPNRRLEQGCGYFEIYEGHVLTLFVIR